MERKPYAEFILSCLAVCVLTAGCGQAGWTEKDAEKESDAGLSPWQTETYQQMALYIQEGFHTYNIVGTYQAYFEALEDEDDHGGYCDILLEGQDQGDLWEERISYTYDPQNKWYTFEGVFEPVFILEEDSVWELREDTDFAVKMRKEYAYSTQISRYQDMTSTVRYHGEGGPVEHDAWKMTPDSEWIGSYVRPYLYTYDDDRMDNYITIEYPQVSLSRFGDDARAEQINETLKEAFFYSYGYDEKGSFLNPKAHAYGKITRNYVITREDEASFSMRIFEYNDFRGANHPNQWETGITINMKTGQALCLQDVVGEDQTPRALLETGAFTCLLPWKDDGESDEEANENWIQLLHEDWERHDRYDDLSEFDSYFYLTPDSLGLIISIDRSFVPMEASFADLGLENPLTMK